MALIFCLDNGRWDLTWKDKAVNNWDMLTIRKSRLSRSFCWLDMIFICISCNLERSCTPPTHGKHMRAYWFNGLDWRRMPVPHHHNDKNHWQLRNNWAAIVRSSHGDGECGHNHVLPPPTHCSTLALFSWGPTSWSVEPLCPDGLEGEFKNWVKPMHSWPLSSHAMQHAMQQTLW